MTKNKQYSCVIPEINIINECLKFFIDNNIEQECVEYEIDSLREIYERILTVMEPYYEEYREIEISDI